MEAKEEKLFQKCELQRKKPIYGLVKIGHSIVNSLKNVYVFDYNFKSIKCKKVVKWKAV